MKSKILTYITLLTIVFTLLFSFGCKKKSSPRLVNAVVSIEFEESQGFFGEGQTDILERAFISDENGLKNFIYKNSNRKKTVDTEIFTSVKMPKSVDYFMPKYSYDYLDGNYVEVNPSGYDNRCFLEDGTVDINGKPSVERFFREREILSFISEHVGLKSLGLTEDDKIENLTVVFSKLNRGISQSDIFWPHQSKVYKGEREGLKAAYYDDGGEYALDSIKLGDKSINSYIFIPYTFIYDGELTCTTLCHEYMHVLGAPDLYDNQSKKDYVGEFDIMGGKETSVPNLSLSYVRYKLGWINEQNQIVPLSKSGVYELFPVEQDHRPYAYKITLPNHFSKGESFYIEYRKLGEGSKTSEPTEGVIIYRVNEEKGYLNKDGEQTDVWRGNAVNEEISVFRFWREIFGRYEERDEITTSGICYATIFDKEGYTKYGTKTDEKVNAITYSNGENSKITVEYLGVKANGAVEIRVDLPQAPTVIDVKESLTAKSGNRHVLTFDGAHYGKTAYVVIADKRISKPKAENLIKNYKKHPIFSVSTEYLQTTLPKNDGIEKFVYVFYGDENGYSEVTEYVISGIKTIDFTVVIVVALIVGVGFPTFVTLLLKLMSKAKNKNKN